MSSQNQQEQAALTESRKTPEVPAPQTPPAAPAKPNPPLHEFIAEADCIYEGRYTTEGTRVTAAVESIPHFRRA
jgi:hypothetical protein